MELLTTDQFREWLNRPENVGKRWELVRGLPVELLPWEPGFQVVQMQIVSTLTDYVIQRGCGSVAFLPGGLITKRNPDTVRSTTAMVFLDPPDADFPPQFTTEVPRLVVELMLPTESLTRQARLATEYVQHGVHSVWFVEPEDRSVTVYRPNTFPKVLDETEELNGNGVLPEFSCRVADFFKMPGASAPPQG